MISSFKAVCDGGNISGNGTTQEDISGNNGCNGNYIENSNDMLKRDKSPPSNDKSVLASFINGSGAISTSITGKIKGHIVANLK